MTRPWLFPIALLVVNGPLAAQSVLTGIVREDSSGRPLSGVEVLLEGSNRKTTTDQTGRYRLDAPTGNRVALFRRLGFRPVRMRATLTKGDTIQSDVSLVRETVRQLDPVEVTGSPSRPRGIRESFEERRRLGVGKFIDSAEMRRAEGRRLSEVLRQTGVRMVNFRANRSTNVEVRAASPTSADLDGLPCFVNVILDGVTIYRSGIDEDAPDFSRDFRPESLESVEYYRRASEVPLEFGGMTAECGVLVMWTRRK